MQSPSLTAHLFDDTLARAWRQWQRRRQEQQAAARADRARAQALQDLRERIAQYEVLQPSYAADLCAALARMT